MRTAPLHTLPFHPPAAPLQRRLWLTTQYAREKPAYNLAYGWRVDGPFDPAAFHAALTVMTTRHEALRSTFTLREGELLRVVHPELPPDFTLVEDVAESDVRELARQEATTRFDLGSGPLLRCRVLRHGPALHSVLLTVHHISVDGRAMGVVREEIAACYEAFVQGRPHPLPPVHRQFSDFAAWQQEGLDTGRFDPQIAYWKERLAGITGPAPLPFLKPRPAVRGREGRWEEILCDVPLTEAARRLAVGARTSVSTVLIAAVARWLAGETGLGEAVLGMSTAGRSLPEFDRLVGLSTNTLPLRIPVTGAAPERLIGETRSVMLAAMENQDVPFPLLMQEIGLPRALPVNPLAQVLVALRDGLGQPLLLAGAEVTPLPAAALTSTTDMTLELDPRPDGTIRGGLLYSPELIDPAVAARLAAGLVGALEDMTSRPRGQRPPAGPPEPGPAADPVPSPASAPVTDALPPAAADPSVRQHAAELWQRLLDGADPADDDDFFASGGDSLLAAEFMVLLGGALDCSLPLDLPVGRPTFGALVAAVTEQRAGARR
ncbi:condensation domain-containing protein [Streptomyces sp. RFCAC02]|uniref:condensation domain-containing protein n=1 Tax=Streptomyces sp. RFCAC02 TaxID=2499143 RepID=UPI00101FFB5C|nr:condensation domain-containing protein [Streptomyces sp. RFCAC02]